jgi:MFS transporter, FHS family, L-fucose permease
MSLTKTKASKNYIYQITIIGLLFAVFGFVTWLNGILMPFLKIACELSDFQAFLILTTFFTPYFIMALPSSFVLQKLGTKLGMSIGLIILAIGTFLFVPAAQSRNFTFFLTAFFIQGTGLALLQTAANPYVSIIGPIESAASRISIMGICNKLAGILGNLIIGGMLLSNSDEFKEKLSAITDIATRNLMLNDITVRIVMPYTIIGVALIIVSAAIYFSSLPNITDQLGSEDSVDTELSKNKKSIFEFPHVWFGALAIFFYVGVEVLAGDVISLYGKNLGFPTEKIKYFTSFGLTGLLLGYVTSIFLIPKYIKQEKWLMICSILGMVMCFVTYVSDKDLAIISIVALNFANAVMWPAIFPLGIRDIGRFTNLGSAILVMGIIGGAILPPFYGWLYEKSGIGIDFRLAYLLVMIVSYSYILWFGLKGHKVGFEK